MHNFRKIGAKRKSSFAFARTLLASSALVASVAATAPAMAEETRLIPNSALQVAQAEVREFSIEAQPLVAALDIFARETGLSFAYRSSDLEGINASAVTGSLSVRDGLEILLRGTSVAYEFVAANTVSLELQTASNTGGPITLPQIVVTGDKLGRTLAESSASVVVLSGEDLDQPQNREIREAIQGIPNVVSDPGFQAPSIRGIDGSGRATGGAGTITGPQSRVPTLVDGVLQQDNISDVGLWDTEQVEVLRGPQTTLGGRNALGGAVRISTVDPVMDDYEAAVRTGYYNENGTYHNALMINIPLLEDQVAFRGTIEDRNGEQFIDFSPGVEASSRSRLERDNLESFRGKVAIQPNRLEGLNLLFSVSHSDVEDTTQNDEDENMHDATITNSANLATRPQERSRTTYQGELIYDLGDHVTVETNAAYQAVKYVQFDRDSTDTNANFKLITDDLSGEFLLRTSDLGLVSKSVFGLAYARTTNDGGSFTTAANRVSVVDGYRRNIGVFGEVEVDLGQVGLAEDVFFIAGLRRETDTARRNVSLNGGALNLSRDEDEVAYVPKIGLRYEASESMVFGYAYTEGYRPGGLTIDLNTFQTSIFDKETLEQHEISARTSWLGGDLDINANAFYYELDGPQLRSATAFDNAGKAIGFGMEIDGSYNLGRDFVLSGGLGLLETELVDAGDFAAMEQFEGESLERAPNVTANLALTYFAPEAVLDGLEMTVTARHVGSMRTAIEENTISDYRVFDLSARYGFDGPYETYLSADAFVTNLFDERYVTELFGARNNIGRPRTVGVSLSAEF